MAETCVNCGNDDGAHWVCTDCLVLIPCVCEKKDGQA
jgi:hypothetical protein